MQSTDRLIAIYDFEFFPYALGDVLTWNVRTAMRCEELGKRVVDLYLCLDERYPASIYQRGLINADNFELFFSELYGAFGTHPKLGNLFIFRQKEAMLEQLRVVAQGDQSNTEALNDYLKVMKYSANKSVVSKGLSMLARQTRIKAFMKKVVRRIERLFPKKVHEAVFSKLSHEYVLNQYFINYVYSHEAINAFYEQKKYIPLLKPSLGCAPDVEEVIARRFPGKVLVPFHLRLRRLDVGYGGDHSYARDSNFLEWYHFLKEAATLHPEVQFIALGRLQEKPLALLRLPNVASLRVYGMGLGHELTLMLKSHFFMGSSSGFAALANFSALPYFITRMNPGSCKAYAIQDGVEKLPFAGKNQTLIYEEETAPLLTRLLQEGLKTIDRSPQSAPAAAQAPRPLNVQAWLEEQARPHHPARTTCRFYHEEPYCQEETAYLLLPSLEEARSALVKGNFAVADKVLRRLALHFPRLCEEMPAYSLLQDCLSAQREEAATLKACLARLEELNFTQAQGLSHV